MTSNNLNKYELYKPFMLELRNKRDTMEQQTEGWNFYQDMIIHLNDSHPDLAKKLEYEELDNDLDESDHP